MLENQNILIVEDEVLIAMELADAVIEVGGSVVGPARSVAEALTILDAASVTAAILDVTLTDRDVTPVGLALAERGIPFIVHSAIGVPDALIRARPTIRLLDKPASPKSVVAVLATEIGQT